MSAIEAALELELLDVDLYRSKNLWKPPGAKGVFGGHVMGLGLVAASKTVSNDFVIHSLHSYFLLPGLSLISSSTH
jgi:acyl-CoA thioesterase II